ncbi:hypothetical protein [Neptunicella sp. SCSIO 80796]|uniref:hypothetical protein n=1 Tax=Neptunicella plasticusilytica TaxID=3117012 RepID=UPI003A4DA473
MRPSNLSNQNGSVSSTLVGKKVFIKRGSFQARIATVTKQLNNNQYELQVSAELQTLVCARSDFIPVKRHKPGYTVKLGKTG